MKSKSKSKSKSKKNQLSPVACGALGLGIAASGIFLFVESARIVDFNANWMFYEVSNYIKKKLSKLSNGRIVIAKYANENSPIKHKLNISEKNHDFFKKYVDCSDNQDNFLDKNKFFLKINVMSDGACLFKSLFTGIYLFGVNENYKTFKEKLIDSADDPPPNFFLDTFPNNKIRLSDSVSNHSPIKDKDGVGVKNDIYMSYNNIDEWKNIMKLRYAWGDSSVFYLAQEYIKKNYDLKISLLSLEYNNEQFYRDSLPDILILHNQNHYDVLINYISLIKKIVITINEKKEQPQKQ